MDLSIIIVNFKTKELTANAIKSVNESDLQYNYEIIVVDNGSSDGSASFFKRLYPSIVLIESEFNEGYAKANNKGIAKSSGRYLLLLNSDTIVRKNTLQEMIILMERNPKFGAAGCKVLLPNGELDKACHRGFPTPSSSFYYVTGLAKIFSKSKKINRYHLGFLNFNEAHQVDCLVGAFMMTRREVIDEVGLLDESFFMYGEDIDWCYRIKEAGWINYYYPRVEILHLKGGGKKKKPFKIVYEFHRAMYFFHKKHYQIKHNKFLNTIVYLGIFIRFCLALLKNSLYALR